MILVHGSTYLSKLLNEDSSSKTLHVDGENGFKIISKTGANVPLDKLSSGEQHQLILMFDLLFEVKSNSLILIDEPELSLHVAWQKSFIESLRRIISLNAFDVLLATHSPAVVARHFSLVVELGPVDE
jgi:predicted ATP-binding protein involved in virulence